jgi:hypothetical protein
MPSPLPLTHDDELGTTLRGALVVTRSMILSYSVFMPKPSTHRVHDPGSIVPHTWPKVFTDNQMLPIKYNY